MRLPISPDFTKFFKSFSKDEMSLFLEKLHFLFQAVEGRSSEVVISEGEQTHSSLGNVKLHLFMFERCGSWETWDVAFFDTAIPHAKIVMWDCNPCPKKCYSLSTEYLQLLFNHSLADIAVGFDDTAKSFLQRLLKFSLGNQLAISGTLPWLYLTLKMQTLPTLHKQFSIELQPKSSFFEFSDYLIRESIFDNQKLIQVCMEKTCIRLFLQENDNLILETLGREQMLRWLNCLNVEFDDWFDATSYCREPKR